MPQSLATRAQDEAVELLHDALLAFPPPHRRFQPDPSVKDQHLPLGGYLLSLGYLTPRQLVTALREQSHLMARGQPLPLGDLLVAQSSLHPQVLTAVLMVQLVDRIIIRGVAMPRLLGEHLIALELLSPLQLAPAIERQMHMRQAGSWARLGNLLINQGQIDEQMLHRALAIQKSLPSYS